MRKNFFAIVFLAICPVLIAQQALNNDAVIQMVKAGQTDDQVISAINTSPGSYNTSVSALTALNSAGVSSRVIAAVMHKALGAPPAAAAAPAPTAAPAPAQVPARTFATVAPAAQTAPAPLPPGLNNDAVIKLVKAGLSDDLIVAAINTQPGSYDTSTDGLIALKSANVSDRVVTAMMTKAAAAPVAPVVAPVPVTPVRSGLATVFIYRKRQFTGSALRPSVYCDGNEVGRLSIGQFVETKVPPGSHTFNGNDNQADAPVTLEAGKEYYFRADLMIGLWKGHFKLTMVDSEQGQEDVSGLKQVDANDSQDEPAAKPRSSGRLYQKK
jgi:hypothetical protein